MWMFSGKMSFYAGALAPGNMNLASPLGLGTTSEGDARGRHVQRGRSAFCPPGGEEIGKEEENGSQHKLGKLMERSFWIARNLAPNWKASLHLTPNS
jgi:hypothetical protein